MSTARISRIVYRLVAITLNVALLAQSGPVMAEPDPDRVRRAPLSPHYSKPAVSNRMAGDPLTAKPAPMAAPGPQAESANRATPDTLHPRSELGMQGSLDLPALRTREVEHPIPARAPWPQSAAVEADIFVARMVAIPEPQIGNNYLDVPATILPPVQSDIPTKYRRTAKAPRPSPGLEPGGISFGPCVSCRRQCDQHHL